MRVLLDTHVFLWWIVDSPRLSQRARDVMRDPDVESLWSAASSWEEAIKYALGRLPLPGPPARFLREQLAINRIGSLPVRNAHAWRVAELPFHHRDPFDRLLVAQAQEERLRLLSGDAALQAYDVDVIW